MNTVKKLAIYIQQKGIEPLAKYIAGLELSEQAAVQRMIDAEDAMCRMMDERQVDDQRFSDLQDEHKDALDRNRKLEVAVRYSNHRFACDKMMPTDERGIQCNCGFDDALADLRGDE